MYLETLLASVGYGNGIFNVPAWSVVLEVFTLSLEHTTLDIDSCWVVFPSIRDVRQRSNWGPRINHLLAVSHKVVPFVVFWHCQRPSLELLSRFEGLICLPLQDAGKCIVCLLDLSHDNRLQLPSGRLQVEVCLPGLLAGRL